MSLEEALAQYDGKEVTVHLRAPADINGVKIKRLRGAFGGAASGHVTLNDVKKAFDENNTDVASKAKLVGETVFFSLTNILIVEE